MVATPITIQLSFTSEVNPSRFNDEAEYIGQVEA